MAKGSFQRHYRFPIEIADGVRVDTVQIEIADENTILEIVGVLEENVPKPGNDLDAKKISEDLAPAQVAEQQLALLVGDDGVDALREILSAYATQKTFFAEVAGSEQEKLLRRVGSSAATLLSAIRAVEAAGWGTRLEIGAASQAPLISALTQLLPLSEFKGSRVSEIPDLEQVLYQDLADWWRVATGDQEPSFWSAGDDVHSPFVHFVNLVLHFLPENLRPTDSRGTSGFGRNALKRRHNKVQTDRADFDKLVEILNRLRPKPPRD